MNDNRESWLQNAIVHLSPLFQEHGAALPDGIRVSCSWPSKSIRKRIGEAWTSSASDKGYHETYISPILSDSVQVLDVLIHELVHHAVGVEHGHKAPFKRLATAIGLQGKMTSTYAGPELVEKLQGITEQLGQYPHGRMHLNGHDKKQSTRLLKCECQECGYTVRTTAKWLDAYGPPICPCNDQVMVTA